MQLIKAWLAVTMMVLGGLFHMVLAADYLALGYVLDSSSPNR